MALVYSYTPPNHLWTCWLNWTNNTSNIHNLYLRDSIISIAILEVINSEPTVLASTVSCSLQKKLFIPCGQILTCPSRPFYYYLIAHMIYIYKPMICYWVPLGSEESLRTYTAPLATSWKSCQSCSLNISSETRGSLLLKPSFSWALFQTNQRYGKAAMDGPS